MKKLGVAIVISLFLIGFVMAISISPTSYTTNNNSEQDDENDSSEQDNENGLVNSSSQESDDENETDIGDIEENDETNENETELRIQNKIREKSRDKLTDEQIKKIFKIKNRIKNAVSNGECPEECTCSGSTMKCMLQSGREMTIVAGNSGNVIIQVKGINATTNVTLYKSDDGKIYAISKNNETKIIKMLPDQVRERIKEKIRARLENESITLDENGTYDYDGEKKAKLFFIIPVKVLVQAEIDPETGKVLEIKNSWWSFLAKDDNEEQIVGAGCGTVTPGQNDACCQNKEYDFWNATASECQFNSSQ